MENLERILSEHPFFAGLDRAFLQLACGCAKVASVAPMGERPKAISPGDWDGTWITKDNAIKIKVTDQSKGVLQAAWAEEKGGRFVLESYELEVWEAGEWTFGNFKDAAQPPSYLWALFKCDEGQITIWLPDPEQFKKFDSIATQEVDKQEAEGWSRR